MREMSVQFGSIKGLPSEVRGQIAAEFWAWYYKNRHVVVLELRVLFLFRKTLTLQDLRPLFERIFGSDPLAYF